MEGQYLKYLKNPWLHIVLLLMLPWLLWKIQPIIELLVGTDFLGFMSFLFTVLLTLASYALACYKAWNQSDIENWSFAWLKEFTSKQ